MSVNMNEDQTYYLLGKYFIGDRSKAAVETIDIIKHGISCVNIRTCKKTHCFIGCEQYRSK